MKVLPVIILISFLLCACGDDARIRRVLDEADRVMMAVPDSAVAMLESMDMGGAPASDRARHALLLTKARRKAHIIETDDSLIRTAVDYYRGRGDSLEVQSLFYNGVVHKFANEYPDALILLMEAYDKACDSGDDFYKAMACREQAAIYTDLYNYGRAAELGREAAETFDKAGKPLHAAWERVYIPQSLAYSGNIDDAYDYVRQLGSDSIILSDPELQKHFLWIASEVGYMKKDYAQAEKYYDALIAAGDTPSSKLLSQMARLKAVTGDIAQARQYWKLATERQEDKSDSLAALWALTEIYKSEGDYKNACLLSESMKNGETDLTNELITHPYTSLLNNYFRAEVNRKSLQLEKSTRDTRTWILVSVTLLIIIVLSIYFYNYRLRQNDLEREILIRDLRSLEARISEIAATKADLPQDRNDDNLFMLDMLKSICDVSGIHDITNDQAKNISGKIAELFTTDENLQSLEKYIDTHYDNLMTIFRRQPVSLNERQYRIAGFVFLGFSDTTIASIFHLSPSAIRQMRYRIRKKLKDNPTSDTDLFLKYF